MMESTGGFSSGAWLGLLYFELMVLVEIDGGGTTIEPHTEARMRGEGGLDKHGRRTDVGGLGCILKMKQTVLLVN